MYWKCQCLHVTHLLSGANMKIKRFRQTVKLENHRTHHSLSPSLFFFRFLFGHGDAVGLLKIQGFSGVISGASISAQIPAHRRFP